MRQCESCGKGSILRGGRKKLRGNYNPTPKKRKYPNLQKSRLANGRKALICVKCIRSASKNNA